MAELIRTFIVRNPEVVAPKNYSLVGIESHPTQFQSARFQKWIAFCKEGNYTGMQSDISNFLQSEESVKSLNDLGENISQLVTTLQGYGNELSKDNAQKVIERSGIASEYNKDRELYANRRMALADTMLGIAHFKTLSQQKTFDYQYSLKVLSYVERNYLVQEKNATKDIARHFNLPILFPSCVIRINPCTKKIETTDQPFASINPNLQPSIQPQNGGCRKDDVKCTCEVDDSCIDQNPCCATITPYIVDLMIAKDYTKCYQAGDLSYIKNVLAGETLSTKHKRLERVEDFSETEETSSTFEEKYLQTEEQSSLQKEINSTVQRDLALDAGVTYNQHWGTENGAGGNLSTDINASYSQSKNTSNKEVRDYAKNVVDRSLKKVEENVRNLVSRKKIFQTKEINMHEFNNEKGENISGQYLYVDKVSRGQVYNYGKKGAIEIYLPEPAALFKKFLIKNFGEPAPIPPKPITIDPSSITIENYRSICNQFGLTNIPEPPDVYTEVSTELKESPGDPDDDLFGPLNGSGNWAFPEDKKILIPVNYHAKTLNVSVISLDYNASRNYDEDEGTWGQAIMGSIAITINGISISGRKDLEEIDHDYKVIVVPVQPTSQPTPPWEGEQTIGFLAWNVTKFDFILVVKCEINSNFITQWQNDIYEQILEINKKQEDEYQKALDEYNKKKEEFELAQKEYIFEKCNRNPFLNREVERIELKRMTISYISCQFFDQFDAMKNRVKPCGFPEMDIEEAAREGKIIQFFEQAFNWNLLTYIFYSYFWGRKCTWQSKFDDASNDLIFQRFLTAGSARVLVPIRDGYFDHVLYFLATGEIWGQNGTPPLPNDPHYVSLAQEIKEQNGNYFTDREGYIDVKNGLDFITLYESDYYWDFGDPYSLPPRPAGVNTMFVKADIDREIIIDCKIYRIIGVEPNPDPLIINHTSWIIKLEKKYEGVDAPNIKWSTGALFVGAPWEFITPTTLTFLRDKSKCLPCYPLTKCEEI